MHCVLKNSLLIYKQKKSGVQLLIASKQSNYKSVAKNFPASSTRISKIILKNIKIED